MTSKIGVVIALVGLLDGAVEDSALGELLVRRRRVKSGRQTFKKRLPRSEGAQNPGLVYKSGF